MSSTMPEDVICFSCGRVISGASGAKARGRREFRGSSTRGAKGKETAKMAAAQASGPGLAVVEELRKLEFGMRVKAA